MSYLLHPRSRQEAVVDGGANESEVKNERAEIAKIVQVMDERHRVHGPVEAELVGH